MNSNFTKVTTLLAVAVLVAAGGCNSEYRNVSCPSRATNVSSFNAHNILLEADCLDKQYSLSSGIHITQQHQILDFHNNSLELRPSSSIGQNINTLLSYSILYGSGIRRFSKKVIEQGDYVSISGQKYASTEQNMKINGKKTVKVRFFCRLDNFLVDRVELEISSDKIISSLCYNFTYVDKISNVFATKIDIYSGKADDFDKVKIREFEYSNFKVIKQKQIQQHKSSNLIGQN